jgi:hypothetical protein
MKTYTIILIRIYLFIYACCFEILGYSSTNSLPVAVGGTVMTDSNGVFTAPVGLFASNAVPGMNPPILIYDEPFVAWGTADGVTWTNQTGWTSTAAVTNGVCDLSANSLFTPWITGRGLQGISLIWSNLVNLYSVVAFTTNDIDWDILESLSDLRVSEQGYRLRLSADGLVPPEMASAAMLDRVTIYGHQFLSRIGATNDFAGIVIKVDNPSAGRDAVNLQYLDERIAAVMVSALSPSTWAAHPAIQAVNLAGQALNLDPRYTLAVSNDTLSLTFGGQPVWNVIGGGVVNPQITYFALTGTQATIRVTGLSGWRPCPQWTSDAGFTNWISLTTNQFSSSYPNLTNGQYTLSFPAVTNSPAFYRVVTSNETGSTGTVMAIHVPLQLNGDVIGAGMAVYVTTTSLAHAVAPLVTTGTLVGVVTNLIDTNVINTPGVRLGNGSVYQSDGVSVGASSISTNKSVAIGVEAEGLQINSLAIGYGASAQGFGATSIGSGSLGKTEKALSIGYQARVYGENAVSLGPLCMASNLNSVVIGYWSLSMGDRGIAIGERAYVLATDGIQLGTGTNTTAGSLQIGNTLLLDGTGRVPNGRMVGWSGVWTNIIDSITNLLLFSNGIATNQVTL